ncbi:MAG: ATP-dependent helicase HrpB [Deltaproteobacteria bacterium]|nr:ATP-dependent helicase HrpB [Deltaproteobacteria bacterium]
MSRLSPLPIDGELPQLAEALANHSAAVLTAETGAGKTTRVPPALLASGLLGAGRIIMVEPRRIAARAAARRIAGEWQWDLGEEVGFQIRFERRAGPDTKILVVTEGVLLRLLQADPFLEDVALVIFDEFHERRLETDLALAMVRRLQRDARSDLRILVMSATLDPQPVARFLGDSPILTSAGRLYPVEISYLEADKDPSLVNTVVEGVLKALRHSSGDILVFLPGVGEIRRAADILKGEVGHSDTEILALYGDLSSEQQDRVLQPAAHRKVVLATNVAETSITVEGVVGVVDSGYARKLVYDAASGLDRLQLSRISRSSADQRAGRAGRQGPGSCWRLWSEHTHRGLPAMETPEIQRADLASAALQLLAWGETDLNAFPWYEEPPAAALDRALTTLRFLGAIDDHGVTQIGRQMVALPAHPRLGRLIIEGHRLGCLPSAALLAALLSERSPFRRAAPGETASVPPGSSDLTLQVAALQAFESGGSKVETQSSGQSSGQSYGRSSGMYGSLELIPGAARSVLRARDQLLAAARRRLEQESSQASDRAPDWRSGLGKALLTAYPDRLARRREPSGRRGVMVGGKGILLARESAVQRESLFLCIEMGAGRRGERSEALVRQASAVEAEWLAPQELQEETVVEFDSPRGRVVGHRRTRFYDLVIHEVECPAPEAKAALALGAAAAGDLASALPLDDPEWKRFSARLACLRQWMPELDLPKVDDDSLRELLPGLCAGKRSFAELRRVPLLEIFRGTLSYGQQQALDREAPDALKVPSGSRIRLRYEPGEPPVLAARIQELFGLKETPHLAAGRVPVLLHLLAPNQRPQQITSDLASFWENTYPQVRKELQGRYPKHAWPQDPLTATPEHRPRRRR